MAAIVNYRDLLLQGSTTRYIPPASSPIYVMPEDLGDLAYLDQVATPQIAPGSITADSAIVAPGAILTQALAANAASIDKSYSNSGPTTLAVSSSSPGPEVTVATLPTFTSKGGSVLIIFGMRTSDAGTYPANNVSGNKLVVRRNGTLIYTLNEIATGIVNIPPVVDAPGIGVSVTYTVGIIPDNFWSTDGPTQWDCNERAAYTLQTIR
jgi:hypothetical protein